MKRIPTLIDGSRLVVEACVRAGADIYVGYPITPVNRVYAHAAERSPLFLTAPDEISALQWMAGLSAAGLFPVTATSFPGFALMLETLNMAYMTELPLLIILGQRLGPSTGSATTGAQGDILLLHGCISGGHPLPVFCPSDPEDVWSITGAAVRASMKFRTPAVLLTSKDMLMTKRRVDIGRLPEIERAEREFYEGPGEYQPYRTAKGSTVPPFLPVGNDEHPVRLNASTHGPNGFISKTSPEAMRNTRRLSLKIEEMARDHAYIDLDKDGSDTLLVTYGISAGACREAVRRSRSRGEKISLLVIKTLLPPSPEVLRIVANYKRPYFVEENQTGLLSRVYYGDDPPDNVGRINALGRPIRPSEIVKEVVGE